VQSFKSNIAVALSPILDASDSARQSRAAFAS
jgi:hypothetical protein